MALAATQCAGWKTHDLQLSWDIDVKPVTYLVSADGQLLHRGENTVDRFIRGKRISNDLLILRIVCVQAIILGARFNFLQASI